MPFVGIVTSPLTKGKAKLSGVKKALGKYGPANVADTAESGATDGKDDDDGIDHFGSEEEGRREEAKGVKKSLIAV